MEIVKIKGLPPLFFRPLFTGWLLALISCWAIPSARLAAAGPTNAWPLRLAAFCDDKEREEQLLSKKLAAPLPSEVAAFFQSARRADCPALTNILEHFRVSIPRRLKSGQADWSFFWPPLEEVAAACRIYHRSGAKYPAAFGDDISRSIPPGSIYFGSSEAGRMLVTALNPTVVEGKPFTVFAANNFIDGWYAGYLKAINDGTIRLPTVKETTDVFSKYTEEYSADYNKHPDPDWTPPLGLPASGVDASADPQQVYYEMVAGQKVGDSVNARLVKWMVDHNPGKGFYYEQGSSLLLMFQPYHVSPSQIFLFPYLSPHDFIFKLNHDSVLELSAKDLDANHEFWSKQVGLRLGNWLRSDTRVTDVCAFVEAVNLRKDLTAFQGDRDFLTNDFAPPAYSRLRLAQADLYHWRLQRTPQAAPAARLKAEADFAFRQAYALNPAGHEILSDYMRFLLEQRRLDDAILVLSTSLKLLPPDDREKQTCQQLLQQLEQADSK